MAGSLILKQRGRERDRLTDRQEKCHMGTGHRDRQREPKLFFFYKARESHTKSKTRSNDPHLQSIGQLEWPAPVQLADVDVAEPTLGEPLLAAGVGDEVLVAPKFSKLHHRAVTEVLQRFAQRREGVHAGFLVAQTQHADCHFAKLPEEKAPGGVV